MSQSNATLGDLNPSVYDPTGGYTPLGKDYATWSCKDLRTITATAGEVLVLLSKSKDMEVRLIGTLSPGCYNYLAIFDHAGDFPGLDEAIRLLDDSEIITLKHWEWLGDDCVFLVYGPSDAITTA